MPVRGPWRPAVVSSAFGSARVAACYGADGGTALVDYLPLAAGASAKLFWPVEPHRVGHEQLALQLGGRCDARNHVDKMPIVGDLGFHVGVRPVGAPEAAVWVISNQGGDGTGEIGPGIAHATFIDRIEPVGAGGLEPDVLATVEQGAKRLHVRTAGALAHVGAAHVVDDERDRDGVHEGA